MIPEEEAVRFEVGDVLRESRLKDIKQLVEVCGGAEALPYFFERVSAHKKKLTEWHHENQ